MLLRVVFTASLATLVTLAGCLESESVPDADGAEAGSGLEDLPCTDPGKQVMAWTWNTGGAASGEVDFEVPNGTVGLRVDGTSDSFVQAQWRFDVLDARDASIWYYEISAPVTAVGQDNNVPQDAEFGAGPGRHTFAWTIEGGATALGLTVTALSCLT